MPAKLCQSARLPGWSRYAMRFAGRCLSLVRLSQSLGDMHVNAARVCRRLDFSPSLEYQGKHVGLFHPLALATPLPSSVRPSSLPSFVVDTCSLASSIHSLRPRLRPGVRSLQHSWSSHALSDSQSLSTLHLSSSTRCKLSSHDRKSNSNKIISLWKRLG